MTRFTVGASAGLQLVRVRDAGQLDTERVILRAEDALELVEYLVLNAHHSGEKSITDLNRDVYWFPIHQVMAGEYVRLYTRSGVNGMRKGAFGERPAVFHDFFWGKDRPIWGGKATAAIVIEIASWQMIAVE
jgi:hypothetical protein